MCLLYKSSSSLGSISSTYSAALSRAVRRKSYTIALLGEGSASLLVVLYSMQESLFSSLPSLFAVVHSQVKVSVLIMDGNTRLHQRKGWISLTDCLFVARHAPPPPHRPVYIIYVAMEHDANRYNSIFPYLDRSLFLSGLVVVYNTDFLLTPTEDVV